MNLLKLSLVMLCVVLCGCGKVAAQNGYFTQTCGPHQHWGIVNEYAMCVPDDGKPPRLVQCSASVGTNVLPAVWVCDKGYVPDGLKVTWPSGIFTPEPERCKTLATPEQWKMQHDTSNSPGIGKQ